MRSFAKVACLLGIGVAAVCAPAVSSAAPGATAISGTASARSSGAGGADFFARNPKGGIQCGMSGEVGSGVAAGCEATTPHRESTVSLYATGKVLVCVAHKPLGNPCDLGNPPLNTPTYGYGHRVTVGRFRCTVLRKGVRCTVRSSGKGFLFSPTRVRAVGGANLRRESHATLSPESPARISGTWMAGPGCGGQEWLTHPKTFSVLCGGVAIVEHARWKHWGAPRATAKATYNDAVLTGSNSVATAPRRRYAVRITAFHIKLCEGRRVYMSVVMHFENPAARPRTLPVPSYLPPSCSKTP